MAEPQANENAVTAPAAPAAPGGLEAEADDWAGDSSFGDDDTASSTMSISSSIMRYREENGRTYHAYKVILLTGSNLARQWSDTKRTGNTISQMMSRRMTDWTFNTISSL